MQPGAQAEIEYVLHAICELVTATHWHGRTDRGLVHENTASVTTAGRLNAACE
jgi:hypothetical protein